MSESRNIELAGLSCGVTIHRPAGGAGRHAGIFYLHGGGLLYGERDDLPDIYINEFTRAGFTLICMDYPLAPETSLPAINNAILEGWRWFADNFATEFGLTRLFLFGRSSGAYLALVLTRTIHRLGLSPAPSGILDFYGYHDLMDRSFWEPADAYAALPTISRATVDALCSGGCVTSGPKARRFSLYVWARQTGKWMDMLGVDEQEARAWSLSPEDIALLPPVFVAASTGDGDVPYRIPKSLFRAKHGTKMFTAYGLEHDFDRDTAHPEGLDCYCQAIAWMKELLDS